jgi:SAM-dependent methyltransferase
MLELQMNASGYYKNTADRTVDWTSSSNSKPCKVSGIQYQANLVESLPISGGRMLDIGCQAGHLIKEVKNLFDRCYGIDVGDYSEYWNNIEGVKFLIHNIDEKHLPFPDSHFDVVTCFMVLEHVFDVFNLIVEISRITAPGKYAVIEVPNIGYIKHIINLLKGFVPRTGAQRYPFDSTDGWDGQHLHYFTLKDLIDLCCSQGMSVIRISTQGRWKWLRRIYPSLLYASLTVILKKN